MSITSTGYVLIIIGIYSLLFNHKLLYNCTIFFIPFSATAVLNIGDINNGSAIQPYMFFGTLFILKSILESVIAKNMSRPLLISEFRPILLFLLLLVIALLSMSTFAFRDVNIMGNVSGLLGDREPVKFSSRNITQYGYFLFGVIFSITLFLYNRKEGYFRNTLKIYGYSMVFVILWGIFQFICFQTGLTYPSKIFNNSANAFVLHDLSIESVLDSNILRISSVGAEPSILSQAIIIYIPFLIFSLVYQKCIFSIKKDSFLLLALIFFMFYTTSSVGILSTIFIILLIPIILLRFFKQKLSIILQISFITFLISLVIGAIFKDTLEYFLFEKSASYSALERLDTIFASWEIFINYPLLGVGLGSITTANMFVRMLSSTGIIGTFIFILVFVFVLKQQLYSRKKMLINLISPYYPEAIIISTLAMIFAANISGFSYVFGNYWLIISLSLVDSLNMIKNK